MGKKTFKAAFALGDTVRDTVTGFVGKVIGISFWLNGCVQCGVKPPVDKDGKVLEAEWFDTQQLEIVKPERKAASKAEPTGGPQRDAPRA
jgi:hypothetical protein